MPDTLEEIKLQPKGYLILIAVLERDIERMHEFLQGGSATGPLNIAGYVSYQNSSFHFSAFAALTPGEFEYLQRQIQTNFSHATIVPLEVSGNWEAEEEEDNFT